MNLIVDIGNTKAKFAIFDKNNFLEKKVVAEDIENKFLQFTSEKAIRNAIVIASGNISDSLLSLITSRYQYILLDENTSLPIANGYDTPDTLGKDRLAAVVGAHALYPQEDLVVIDCGTCTTYNFLENHKFMGGNITPGLYMRNEAMHRFTDKLPMVLLKDINENIGNNTVAALHIGGYLGAVIEMKGWIQLFRKKNQKLKVIITGGNAQYFYDNIKLKNIVIEEDIVLKGLNHILNFNFA